MSHRSIDLGKFQYNPDSVLPDGSPYNPGNDLWNCFWVSLGSLINFNVDSLYQIAEQGGIQRPTGEIMLKDIDQWLFVFQRHFSHEVESEYEGETVKNRVFRYTVTQEGEDGTPDVDFVEHGRVGKLVLLWYRDPKTGISRGHFVIRAGPGRILVTHERVGSKTTPKPTPYRYLDYQHSNIPTDVTDWANNVKAIERRCYTINDRLAREWHHLPLPPYVPAHVPSSSQDR